MEKSIIVGRSEEPRERCRSARRRFNTALLALAGTATLTPAAARAATPALQPGSKLPLVDLPLIEGGRFRAAEAEGKVVVVYWWASWCPFCAAMSPSIEKLWRSQRARGLTVIGISIDNTVEAAKRYRQRRDYTFPSAMHSADTEGALPKPVSVPTLWVANRAGRVVMVEKGQMFPEDIDEIAKLV